MAEIGVHICVDQEDDPGEGGSQQVDPKEVVDTVNVEHGDVDVNAKTVETANMTKMREDNLREVLEIFKGDQVEENNASKEISGVSKESNKEEDEATAEF